MKTSLKRKTSRWLNNNLRKVFLKEKRLKYISWVLIVVLKNSFHLVYEFFKLKDVSILSKNEKY
jgi:hypothetical protein